MPVRNRYKVFIIDEVHQLSTSSFNALLKSIEEPPPHIVFMMATTELAKIPETVLSRSQVFEFKTISSRQIADQLRRIADAEKISVDESALLLVARAAEGSMRDAQSAFDQVIAFAGQTVTTDDVSTVLGLVGRDLLLDVVTAVADETPAAAFELSGRAVELGYDLRAVVRELSRVVRDLLVLSVDPGRIDDPEIASEGEQDRLKGLVSRFSREDLLRAFDLLAKAEFDIRGAAQPRYHLEMALLRWIHMRKLVPLTELLGGGTASPTVAAPRPVPVAAPVPQAAPAFSRKAAPVVPPVERRPPPASPKPESSPAGVGGPVAPPATPPKAASVPAGEGRPAGPKPVSSAPGEGRDAFLMEIRKSKQMFYNTVVAQAQKIEFGPDRVTFSFLPAHRMLREQVESNRQWLEQTASAVAGRRMTVGAAQAEGVPEPVAAAAGSGASQPKPPDL
jgi:DNA polymerase-3 subunit gamma/tau